MKKKVIALVSDLQGSRGWCDSHDFRDLRDTRAVGSGVERPVVSLGSTIWLKSYVCLS